MKFRKRVAAVLAATMCFNSVSTFAYIQKPIEEIGHAIVSHQTRTESSTDIIPDVTVEFPEAPTNTVDVTGEDHKDTDSSGKPTTYKLKLTRSDGTELKGDLAQGKHLSSNGMYSFELGGELDDVRYFTNGSLYKFQAIPGHQYISGKDNYGHNIYATAYAPESSSPVRYFLTDFNIEGEQVDNTIQYKWEYIEGATYELVYVDENIESKDEMVSNNQVNTVKVSNLNADEMEMVTEEGQKKVVYTVENITPGKIYSAYVIPTNVKNGFLQDRWENVDKNTTNPKVIHVSTNVALDVTYIGNGRIELAWELGDWAKEHLVKATIYARAEGETAQQVIGTIFSSNLSGATPSTFEYDEPDKKTYYQIIFDLEEGHTDLETNEVEYIPYELRTKPLKPQIPLPYSRTLNIATESDRLQYVVTGDDVSSTRMESHTFHTASTDPLKVQLVWDAQKKPQSTTEIDYDLTYDIWVTEDQAQLEEEPVIKDLNISSTQSDSLIKKQNGETVVGLKTLLTEYTNSKSQVKELVSNKTYYIKVVAKRAYGEVVVESQPTFTTITIDKTGDISVPPVIGKPPLQVKEGSITPTSATLEWLETWYEIRANDLDMYTDEEEKYMANFWHPVVYTGGKPAIKFESESGLTRNVLKTESILNTVKNKVGVKDFELNYASRKVSLGDNVQYEVKPILYDNIIEDIKGVNSSVTTTSALTIEKWIVENESDTTAGWTEVTPKDVYHSDDALTWKEQTVDGLTPNTRYVILIRAYRVTEEGEKLIQTYPSYVIVTTDTDFESEEAIPTVPVLHPNGVTEESVSVWWTYNSDFEYEIRYSRSDDPEKATVWPYEFSSTPGDKNYVANGEKAIVTITGLAPETSYNVWIKAKQKKGDKESEFSNPVRQKTDSIEAPDTPRGLGKASNQTIIDLGHNFSAIGKDYITVEWMRINADQTEDEKDSITYDYVIEIADNKNFLDAVAVNTTTGEVEGDEETEEENNTNTNSDSDEEDEENKEIGFEVLDKTVVRFNNLNANKTYYFRVKTVLTYSNEELDKIIIKESEFSGTVSLKTGTSSDEYDGGDNENVVIYPNPVEETYKDGIWTYEIVDAAKVSTQILESKDYFYTVTLENYKNKYNATTRRLVMPVKVANTIANQGMALKVVTNIGTYEIPGKALKHYLAKYKDTDKVQIDLTRQSYSDIITYVRSYPEQYQSGEKLDIIFRGATGSEVVYTLDSAMKINLKLDVVASYSYSNYATYLYNYAKGSWESYAYQIDTTNNKYAAYNTMYTGLNALYSKPVANSNSNASYLMNALTSAYNITGLGTVYTESTNVKASQYVTLLLGIAKNKSAIDLTQNATAADYAAAKASGLYISSSTGNVTREQALAGVVKLYELKHGTKIKASNMVFSNVSSNYRSAASKAYAVGIIDSMQNPQASVTYGELCDWIALAID